jgi:VWFA-related protein
VQEWIFMFHPLRLLIPVIAITFPLCAQQAVAPNDLKAPAKVTTRSDLVLVPVIVTDKSGHHVGGLPKDAFRIEENGKLQNVSIFEEVKTENKEVAAGASTWQGHSNFAVRDPRSSRITIVVLDMINTPWMRQVEAKRRLTAYLLRNVNREEPTALFGLNSGGLRQLHPFTTDTQVLIDALKKLNLSLSSEESTQPAKTLLDDDTSEQQNSDLQQMSDFMADMDATITAMYERQAIRQTLHSMSQLARAYGGLPGRKTLIWATAGFPFMIDDPQAFARMGDDMREEFEQTWRALGSANIAVYPVDLSALDISQSALPSSTYNQGTSSTNINNIRGSNGLKSAMSVPYDKAMQQQLTLHAFADSTGGRACITTNELERCFAAAVDDSREYYLLGYYLEAATKPGWRKLKVKVSGEGLHERSRQGFYVSPKAEDTPELRHAELVEALTSPVEYTGLRLNVQQLKSAGAQPVASTTDTAQASAANPPQLMQPVGDKKPAEFLLAVLGNSLTIDRQADNAINLEVAAVAFDTNRKNAGTISQSIVTNLKPDLMQKVLASSLGIKQQIGLSPGRYQIKFAVRDNLSGDLGTLSLPIEIK